MKLCAPSKSNLPSGVKATIACGILVVLAAACGSNDPVDAVSRSVIEIRTIVRAGASEVTRSATPQTQMDAMQAVVDDLEDRLLQENYLKNHPDSGAYGPCTVVHDKLSDAVSLYAASIKAGKTKAANAALAKAKASLKQLEDYHAAAAMEAGYDQATARTMASYQTWIDYQQISPIVGGMRGRRPTAAQYARLRTGLTGERARIADEGIEAWKQGALVLFGRPGPITREEARNERLPN